MRDLKGLIFLLFSVIFLIVLFTACGNSTIEEHAKNTEFRVNTVPMDTQNLFNNDDLTVYDTILNTEISLGMEKSNVDKLLGLQEKKDFKSVYNYQGLEVFYRDNKVAGLIIKAALNETDKV